MVVYMGHISKILYILCTEIIYNILYLYLYIIYFTLYIFYKGGGGVYGTRIQVMDSTNNHLHNQLLCSCSSFDDINVICELSYQEYSVSQNPL